MTRTLTLNKVQNMSVVKDEECGRVHKLSDGGRSAGSHELSTIFSVTQTICQVLVDRCIVCLQDTYANTSPSPAYDPLRI